MTAQIGLQIGLILLIVFLLSIPVGRYLADIVMDRKTRLDPVFDPVDGAIYWLIGREAIRRPMNWKAYTFHMLATNLFMALLIYLILVLQDYLPLNPLKLLGMEPVLDSSAENL
jgi:K+-transporting ATPase ATPase A chain